MNIIKQTAAAVARMRTNWRMSNQQAHIDAIRHSFYLDEKDGIVYIIHNAVAIVQFTPSDSIETITERLNQIRSIAVNHEYGIQKSSK